MKKTITLLAIAVLAVSCSKGKKEVAPDATIEFFGKYPPYKVTWYGSDGRHDETITEQRKVISTKYDKAFSNYQQRVESQVSTVGDSVAVTFKYEGKTAFSYSTNKSGSGKCATGVNYYSLK